jgi:hypothetical protein
MIVRKTRSLTASCFALLALLLSSGLVFAQEADTQPAAEPVEQPAEEPAAPPDAKAAEAPALPEIPDEPKTVDPATFMPPKLAEPVTVDFTDSSIGEVAEWIRTEHGFAVLIDESSLGDEGILVSDPVSDKSGGVPLYLLLNRLRAIGVDWYVEDDVLWITTPAMADERLTTEQYLIGDLLDMDYDQEKLIDTIANETSGPWWDVDGIGGSIEVLGDVMFVRHTAPMQREVAGLLTALRKHARMTFTLDPPQHEPIREKLNQNVDADFDDEPLIVAIHTLGERADVDVRVDLKALKDVGVRDRQPVSLTLAGRPLHTVLHVLLSPQHLTWILRDGVLWITSTERAEDAYKAAVFDVRDLCRDQGESDALQEAIQEQTSGPWFDLDGIGGTITFAQPGAMVVRQPESGLFEVLNLLETYREALRLSKPREREGIDMEEFVTTYYRMDADIADDLVNVLPVLVRPDTWRSEVAPEAKGTILEVASKSDLRDVHGRTVVGEPERNDQNRNALVVSQAVLIIHQSRVAHEEIAEVIRRVQAGDAIGASGAVGGGGFGGGGFGGGFFSTSTD